MFQRRKIVTLGFLAFLAIVGFTPATHTRSLFKRACSVTWKVAKCFVPGYFLYPYVKPQFKQSKFTWGERLKLRIKSGNSQHKTSLQTFYSNRVREIMALKNNAKKAIS